MNKRMRFIIGMLIFPKKIIADKRLENYKTRNCLIITIVGIIVCSYLNVLFHPEFEKIRFFGFGFSAVILAVGILIELLVMYIIVKIFRVKEFTLWVFMKSVIPYKAIQSLLSFVVTLIMSYIDFSIFGIILNVFLHFWIGNILYLLLRNYKQSVTKSIIISVVYIVVNVFLLIFRI